MIFCFSFSRQNPFLFPLPGTRLKHTDTCAYTLDTHRHTHSLLLYTYFNKYFYYTTQVVKSIPPSRTIPSSRTQRLIPSAGLKQTALLPQVRSFASPQVVRGFTQDSNTWWRYLKFSSGTLSIVHCCQDTSPEILK